MTRQEFHQALAILRFIDQDELVAAGVIQSDNIVAWNAFNADPVRQFFKLDDDRADKLWTIIERRMGPKPLVYEPHDAVMARFGEVTAAHRSQRT